MKRDFTYIDDVVDGIHNVIRIKIKEKFVVLNIGKGKPDNLMDLISSIQKYYGRKFKIKFTNNIPSGDIKKTFANTFKAKKTIKWKPKVSLAEGIKRFVDWYKKLMITSKYLNSKNIIEFIFILLPISLVFSNIVSELLVFILIVFYLSSLSFNKIVSNLKEPIILLLIFLVISDIKLLSITVKIPV